MSYDFIIVGGGSAGCVLAARLSENPDASVLLLEAGGRDWHPFYHVPAGFAKMTKGIGSWGWTSVPQRHMQNMQIRYTQAKVIGGGSAINAQIYTRGNALDYDGWQRAGCAGWSYEDVLPYFRKAEDNDSFYDRYHGSGGPLGVSKPSAPLPICDAYFAAAAELGIPFNADMTGEKQEGVGYYQLTQRKARRSSTAMAYLAPNRHRRNLIVKTGVQVRRIIVANNRASGVMRQAALKPFIKAERLPGPDIRTEQDYIDFACRHAKTDHHPVGTCRMGSDAQAVVDPRLQFKGIEALRIVDASIMPTLVSSNTNAATIMIAEKAADMIRADNPR